MPGIRATKTMSKIIATRGKSLGRLSKNEYTLNPPFIRDNKLSTIRSFILLSFSRDTPGPDRNFIYIAGNGQNHSPQHMSHPQNRSLALVIQSLAVVAQPITIRTRPALVLRNFTPRPT